MYITNIWNNDTKSYERKEFRSKKAVLKARRNTITNKQINQCRYYIRLLKIDKRAAEKYFSNTFSNMPLTNIVEYLELYFPWYRY